MTRMLEIPSDHVLRELSGEDELPPTFAVSHLQARSEEKPAAEGEQKQSVKDIDPIRWFGILVPPALRSAQSSFIKTIEGTIPQLTTLSVALRGLEMEIGRQQKAIRKLEKS